MCVGQVLRSNRCSGSGCSKGRNLNVGLDVGVEIKLLVRTSVCLLVWLLNGWYVTIPLLLLLDMCAIFKAVEKA